MGTFTHEAGRKRAVSQGGLGRPKLGILEAAALSGGKGMELGGGSAPPEASLLPATWKDRWGQCRGLPGSKSYLPHCTVGTWA